MATPPTLSNFELMVMLAIIRIGDDAYGVSISNEIEETTGSEVLLGSVYDALTRLQEKGLIASTLGEATPERGGRAKRHFRTTARGLRLVRDTQQSLVKLWKGLPQLKGEEA
ncbi:MAG TPA: helix-turn-helix transcriptional regulator [Terriglobia bacterium]|jgi:PadR family transcriptional regulator, regulatory protein PadR|nr:helix-turn-helix transcriptional regulator [Terriglobia bacterium]